MNSFSILWKNKGKIPTLLFVVYSIGCSSFQTKNQSSSTSGGGNSRSSESQGNLFNSVISKKNALILNIDANRFVPDMVRVFGAQNPSWKNELGFTVTISPLQDSDERIFNQLSDAFLAAKQNNYRLLIHVNNEWLFHDCAYCSDNEAKHANAMVEKITGVRVLTDKSPREYMRVDSSPEVLRNIEWTSWTQPQDVHMLAWGDPPTAMPPRINFASQEIRELLKARTVAVKAALKKCFGLYFPQTDPLFEGINLGWETGIEDQDANVKLGFGALKTLGYSANSKLSPDRINQILFDVAKDFMDFQASLYSDFIDTNKMFSHYAVYGKNFTSGLPYRRAERNPDQMAQHQALVPGFSIYLCSESGCPDVYEEMRENISSAKRGWVVTESTPKLAKVLLDGFPSQGIPPPRFVVAYNFSANDVNDEKQIYYIKRALGQVTSSETGSDRRTEFKGIFEANGNVHYSNGSVFCTYKDWQTFSCMTGEGRRQFPLRPDLLSVLANGGFCQIPDKCGVAPTTKPTARVEETPVRQNTPSSVDSRTPSSTPQTLRVNYQGIFTALGGINYSNGNVYCFYKNWSTFVCMTGRTSTSGLPDRPEWLQILTNGGECQPEPRCQNL